MRISVSQDWGIEWVLHWQEIFVLVTGFVLAMIESPGARIVVAICLVLGLIFAIALRILDRKSNHGATSILPLPPVIK
jgi:ABC-type bacteriocin/lantibiotic exporter with double-glycine peptidase domain